MSNLILKDIGEKLYLARTNKGLTQQQLADILMMDRSSISHIEKGRSGISVTTLWQIVEALGLRISLRIMDTTYSNLADEEATQMTPPDKKFSDKEIDAVIAHADDEPTFATTAHVMLKQLQRRVQELEGENSVLKAEKFRLQHDAKDKFKNFQEFSRMTEDRIQTLERERDEAVNQIYSALQFGYCHADLGWQGMMKIKESADYRKLFHSIFEPKNEVK